MKYRNRSKYLDYFEEARLAPKFGIPVSRVETAFEMHYNGIPHIGPRSAHERRRSQSDSCSNRVRVDTEQAWSKPS